MKKKKIVNTVITIAILGGLVLVAGNVLSKNKEENAAKTAIVAQADGSVAVRTIAVQKDSLVQNIMANGNFIPGQQINFSAENSGRVTKVLVDEGSNVRVGQVLAIIKADQLNVDVESAEAAYINAKNDLERYQSALQTGGVTGQQVDQAKLALTNAQARLQQARLKVGDTYVRSSINGVVNKRLIEPGAVVAPGTQMFEIVNIAQLKLAVTVNEQQVAQLQEGDIVKIKLSVFPDESYSGKISFIAPKSDETLSFPLEISLTANPGNKIRAGMYGTAEFDFGATTPVLMLPRTAFVGSVSNNQVFVSAGDSVARLRTVTAGRIVGENVEILQGLTEGEKVITSGQVNLNDGTAITIVK